MNNGHYQKIAVTAQVEGSEDPKKALYEAKKIVTNFFYESNKSAEKKEQEIVKEQPLSRTEAIIKDISSVTELKVLESYKLIAAKDPLIQEAYDNKLNQLK
jgi:vacuolar-type H+-ATPase subunit H